MSEESKGLSVTIKYGKGYDDSWVVFRGRPGEIRSDIIDFFGMERESVAGLSLSSIVVNATNVAHGKGLIATSLGATVISEEPAAPASPPSEDPWAAASAQQAPSAWSGGAAQESKAEDPNAYILGEIEKKTSVQELKKLWAENQSFFKDAAVMAAWKAKGKSLQTAA